jgi:hypothetical protein
MPPILYDEFAANGWAASRNAADLLVENSSVRYRDEIHLSQVDAYRVTADIDDVLTDLVWNHASDEEVSERDRLADAALTDLMEQDVFGRLLS